MRIKRDYSNLDFEVKGKKLNLDQATITYEEDAAVLGSWGELGDKNLEIELWPRDDATLDLLNTLYMQNETFGLTIDKDKLLMGLQVTGSQPDSIIISYKHPQTADDFDLISRAMDGELGEGPERIVRFGIDWLALMVKKNIDYGGTVWEVPVLAPHADPGTAILVRMSDKVSRLNNLLAKKSETFVDESIDDTLKDLGAYCLLYLSRPIK